MPCFDYTRARSSAEERLLDMQEVGCSIHPGRTIQRAFSSVGQSVRPISGRSGVQITEGTPTREGTRTMSDGSKRRGSRTPSVKPNG